MSSPSKPIRKPQPSKPSSNPTPEREEMNTPRSHDPRPSAPANRGSELSLNELKEMRITELAQLAKKFNLEGAASMRKSELIFSVLKAHTENGGVVFAEGVLEILPDGFGFLRAEDYNYLPGADDIYVSPSQIRKFQLKTGDTISGHVRPPKDSERYFALLKVESLNFESPDMSKDKILFDNLTPLYPQDVVNLEYEPKNYA